MKSSLYALIFVSLAAVFTSLLVFFIPVPSEVLNKISVTILGFFPLVRAAFEGRPHRSMTIPRFEGYGKSRLWVVASGTMLVVAVMTIIDAVASLFAAIYSTEIPYDQVRGVSTLVLKGLIYVPALILIGRYVAAMSRKVSWLDPVVVSLLATLVLFIIHLSDDYYVGQRNLSSLSYGFVERLPFLAIGSYLGRRLRFANYLDYLLKQVPADTRHAIVELAHEEAIRSRSTLIQPSATAT